jgi:hypothetical protein
VDVRSDPAGTTDEMLGIAWIAALKNHFDASEHLPRTPGVDNLTAGHLYFDAKVAFNPSNRINDYSLAHFISSLLREKIGSTAAAYISS